MISHTWKRKRGLIIVLLNMTRKLFRRLIIYYLGKITQTYYIRRNVQGAQCHMETLYGACLIIVVQKSPFHFCPAVTFNENLQPNCVTQYVYSIHFLYLYTSSSITALLKCFRQGAIHHGDVINISNLNFPPMQRFRNVRQCNFTQKGI